MTNDRLLSMIGLAKRAGAACIGAFMTERAIHDGTCELIILASDTAANNRKKFVNSSKYYGIPLIEYSTKEELSHALGKKNVVVVGIADKNFAKGILDKYELVCEAQAKAKS